MAATVSIFTHTERPLTRHLNEALTTWSTSQRAVVGLAADFATSGEWGASGAASAAHWIADVADIEVGTAREWIRVGKALRRLPEIADAFERDELSYSKVRTLSRVATPETEMSLIALAKTVPAGQLPRAIAAWRHRGDDGAALERHQFLQRGVGWRVEPDGMVAFTARLEPLVAAALIARLTSWVMSNQPEVLTFDEWPTVAQQHADALAALIEGDESVRRLVTEVVLHVRGDGAALDDGTPLPLSSVIRVAPEAFVRALVHDAAGRPINASARRRHPSVRQKRVVKERDRACVDCGAATLLEFDHVPDFAITHHTVVDELQLRCAPCHHRRHAEAGAA
ncbi:MAG: DUF222 domain-containing protein [Ilumatobacter sp.]|uniref:HNH endonuclease signature motif containing protein n=1 Tax=Ilumatobacter sp. TaxID=1967498 RepID=UPI00391942E3